LRTGIHLLLVLSARVKTAKMETREVAKPAPARTDDLRLPHVHSTRAGQHRDVAATASRGQAEGPWRRYQLTVGDRQPAAAAAAPTAAGGDGRGRGELDPATRAGCVPATAYPSFRTIPPPPPPPPAAQKLPRVSRKRSVSYRVILHTHTHTTARCPGARFTKYLTTILRLSYDNAIVTIDLRRTSIYKTSYAGRKAFLRYDSLAKL